MTKRNFGADFKAATRPERFDSLFDKISYFYYFISHFDMTVVIFADMKFSISFNSSFA